MELIMEEKRSLEYAKEIVKNLNIFEDTKKINNQLGDITVGIIDRSANYIIKAMPVPDAIKDILKDVKDSIKTNDFKLVIKTAVRSSIREGLELLGVGNEKITNLVNAKDLAIKGGLSINLKNAVGVLANKYLNSHLVADEVYQFFDKLKNYILSKEFNYKLIEVINKLVKKKENFMNMCNNWYKAYSKLDIPEMNELSKSIMKNKDILLNFKECSREGKIISNMTNMVNNKNSKLTEMQLNLCKTI